ncbi:unnamed protein product [Sympodiomycopsis kandeliae]
MPSPASVLRLARVGMTAAPTAASSLRNAVLLQRQFHASRSALELSKFNMPAMSPTMTEGGIAQWKKKEGEAFSAGDVLLEIETDKATMDVEAQDDGVLAKIIIGDGSKTVPVNSAIAILAEEGDDLSGADALASEASKEAPKQTSEAPKEESKDSEPEPKQSEQSSSSSSSSQQQTSSSSSESSSAPSRAEGERVIASPLAKKIALEKGIPLAQVKGTGPNGRIVKADVEGYKPSAAPSPSASAPATQSQQKPAAAAAAQSSAAPTSTPYTDIPVSGMRKIIASRLTESKSTIPHYYVSVDVEMDKVLRLRQIFNDASAKKFQADPAKAKESKLSLGDFITKAVAVALDEVPDVRAGWNGDSIRQYNASDISIAVSTPTGLITPIVTDVGHRGLSEISSETKSLAKLARDGKLKSEQYQGGAFTISNMGMFGPTWFSAIINPPQAAILAIGTTRSVMVPDAESEKGFKVVQVMSATASFDHRVVDGATGAQWCAAFKRALENPLSFML